MVSNQSISDVADFFGAYTYKDDLIWFLCEDIDNWRHRELVLRKDPFIRTYVSKLDKEILYEKPIFTPDIFGGKEQKPETSPPTLSAVNGKGTQLSLTPPPKAPRPPLDGSITTDFLGNEQPSEYDVSEEWENEKWTSLLIKMMDKTRAHRFSVIQLYDKGPYWRVFCDREITEIYYDDEDTPIGCKVEWSRSMPKSNKYMNFSEEITFYTGNLADVQEGKNYGLLVPFGTPPSEDQLGELDIEDLWSLSVYIRYALLDVVQNSAKCSGFYWLMYGSAIDDTSRQALLNSLDLAGSGRGVGAGENILKQLTAMYPAHPEFSVEALAEFIRQFAMTARVPLAYFRSESEKGSLFGDQSGDEIKLNKKKEYLFGLFAPYIKTLIKMRWGIEIEDVKPNLLAGKEEQISLQDNFQNRLNQPKEEQFNERKF